jgi:uncharacterized membrane protein (UPF0127 family)
MLAQLNLGKVDVRSAAVQPLGLMTVWHARRFFERLRGLLGRPALQAQEALLLSPCGQVHTFGMHTALDVVFLDQQGRVLKCVETLRPNRVSGAARARHTLELAAGSIARQGLCVGDRRVWETL